MFAQCGARITQACDKHTRTRVDVKSVSHKTSNKSHSSACHQIDVETENLRSLHLSCLNFEPPMASCVGQVCNVCPHLLALLSLLMWQTPQATVDTNFEVNKLARKAIVWAHTPLTIHAHHSHLVVTYTDAGWTTRPDGTSQGGQLVFITTAELLQGRA